MRRISLLCSSRSPLQLSARITRPPQRPQSSSLLSPHPRAPSFAGPRVPSMSKNAQTWSFGHSSAAHASALFCPDCQSILDLPDADLILRCPVCHYQMKFTGEDSRYEKLSISTKYSTAASNDEAPEAVPAFTRAKVKERCPQCNHPEMSFYTMQMRSVDEGQTVFFECGKCGHTFSTNT